MGLLAVLEAPRHFRRCLDKERLRAACWPRVELLLTVSRALEGSPAPSTTFGMILFLADGTTIGVVQFEAVWQTLGLAGDRQNRSFPISYYLRDLRRTAQ